MEKQVLSVTDELAHLINEEEQAVVLVLLLVDKLFQLCAESLRTDILLVVHDGLANRVNRNDGHQFLGYLQDVVEHDGGKHTGLIVPIEAFVSKTLLEVAEQSCAVEYLFEVLRQGEVEGIVATKAVELVPEHLREDFLLVGICVVNGTDVEQHHINIGFGEPCGQLVHVINGDCTLGVADGQRVTLFHRLFQSGKSFLAAMRIDAIAQELQKMGFSRTKETVDPDAIMTYVLCPNGVQHIVQTIDDFIGEHILIDFRLYGFVGKVFCRYRRIERTVDSVLI